MKDIRGLYVLTIVNPQIIYELLGTYNINKHK